MMICIMNGTRTLDSPDDRNSDKFSYPNYKYGESCREEKEVSKETSSQPDEGQVPVDELELLSPVCPGHQVPAL